MIRYPNITGSDPQKLEQIKRYLIDLADELNFVLDQDFVSTKTVNETKAPSTSGTQESAVSKFNEIKGFIIKSADIVNAYYETINKKLEGVYVAESDYGTFAQQTAQYIQANSTYIKQIFSDYSQIDSKVKGIESSIKETNAYIKSGLLEEKDGNGVYGIEIGQGDGDGFSRFARFTAGKLSFYDQSGPEVAWISNNQLFIKTAEVQYKFVIGGFIDEVQTDKSIVTKWIGG